MFGLVVSLLTSLFLLFSVSESTCNYGVFGTVFPLVTDECNTCSGDDCGNFESIETVCNDSDVASLVQYEGNSCSGTVYNTTYPDDYVCGETGSCDIIVMILGSYSDADCGGSADAEITLLLAGDAQYCVSFGSGIYGGVSLNDSAIIVGIYFDSDCASTVLATTVLTDGTCSNGTLYSFGVESTTTGIMYSTQVDTTSVDSTSVDTSSVDSTSIDTTSVDSTLVDISSTGSTSVDMSSSDSSDSSDSGDTAGCNSINNYYALMKIIGVSISITVLGITIF